MVIAAYLIGVTVLGTTAARRVKSSASFFISDRRSGKLLMTLFNFGTGTNTDQAVTVASKTYTAGASGIWYQWLWLFATPVYWLIAPLFRRMRAVTTADYLFVRYGPSVAVLFSIVGIAQMSVNIGVVLRATASMIAPVSGGVISPTMAIVGMTVLFVIYGVAGGLSAAILTDAVQGVLTVVLSFLLLPFALNAVGGLSGLRAAVDDPNLFSIVAPGEITVLYVVVIAVNALVGWVTAPYSMQMTGAGRTEDDARVGLVAGMFLKRIVTIAWVLTGMCAVGLYAGSTIDPDQVYGLMARDLLPMIAPGLIGLFIASMLAAVMSSCDCLMVAAAALFTENVYRPYIRADADERHYVLVGRLASIAVVGAGLLVAFTLSSVVEGAGDLLEGGSDDGNRHLGELRLATSHRRGRLGIDAGRLRRLVFHQRHRLRRLELQRPLRGIPAGVHALRRRPFPTLADDHLPGRRPGADGRRELRYTAA